MKRCTGAGNVKTVAPYIRHPWRDIYGALVQDTATGIFTLRAVWGAYYAVPQAWARKITTSNERTR